MPLFHPKIYIQPTNFSDDVNIFTIEGLKISDYLSNQNIDLLTDCGGVKKYLFKYIGNIDKIIYVIIYVEGIGYIAIKTFYKTLKILPLK